MAAIGFRWCHAAKLEGPNKMRQQVVHVPSKLLMFRIHLFPIFSLAVSTSLAQPQLDNPSFEAWTDAGQATQEPTDWSSLKTSDGGAIINSLVPQLCWRSTDAHSGTYSVNLRTVSSVAGTANGLLTNGRVHAELTISNSYMFTDQGNTQWNTPMNSRPDSLVGWFKATPQTGDRANVGALLHVDEGRLPAFGTEGNYVAGASWKAPYATVGQWTRFSTPFQYLNGLQPEWVLLILTAGDSAGSEVGTQAWFDDLALIYNLYGSPSTPVAFLSGTEPFALSVDYSTGGIPVAPTLFTAQLSDVNGDFANPIELGALTSASPIGTIPCLVPTGTPAGEGYRIRVVAPSVSYAPVPAPFTIETLTGVRETQARRVLVRILDDRPFLDLRGTGMVQPSYELIDMGGKVVGSGVLKSDALNELSGPLGSGTILVRIIYRSGVHTERIVIN